MQDDKMRTKTFATINRRWGGGQYTEVIKENILSEAGRVGGGHQRSYVSNPIVVSQLDCSLKDTVVWEIHPHNPPFC